MRSLATAEEGQRFICAPLSVIPSSFAASDQPVVGFDPLRDKSYQRTRLGRDIVDFLAWKQLGGMRPRTLDQYERDLARGALMFPTKGVADITEGDALHIAGSYPPKGRRVRVASWQSLYKWAIRAHRCDRNPFDALPRLKRQPKKVQDIFAGPEIASLCNLPIRDGALMQLMFDTGARKGDCRTFRWAHYRAEQLPDGPYGMVVFYEGKGGKDRQVPATEPLAQKLNELALLEGLRPLDHLWWTRPGGGTVIARDRPMGDASFDRWWRTCLEQADVRYRNPHTTRHTFATRFLRQRRGRLETLQLVLGHESIQTTYDLYGHLDMRDVAYDLGLVSEVRAGPPD